MDKIYAVTVSHSVYELDLNPAHRNPWPIVVKIKGSGKSAVKVGEQLLNGHFVGIGSWGIVLYNDPHGGANRPDDVNNVNWKGKTSQVVALFALKRQATMCSKKQDLKPFDPRWHEATLEILRHIGDDHPVVKLSHKLAQEIAQT